MGMFNEPYVYTCDSPVDTMLSISTFLKAFGNRTFPMCASNLAAKSIRNINIIPALPAGDFEVGQDQIHWTESTANKLYRSWMTYLNLN